MKQKQTHRYGEQMGSCQKKKFEGMSEIKVIGKWK